MRLPVAVLLTLLLACGSSSNTGARCTAAGGSCVISVENCDGSSCVPSCPKAAPSADQDCNGSGVTCCIAF
jgi:hypothetical protein